MATRLLIRLITIPLGIMSTLALADMIARLAAAHALVYAAARAMDWGPRPFDAAASLAQLVASEATTWIAERALLVQGAQVICWTAPQRYYRDCKVIEWGEGVNELQREMIIETAVAAYRP